MVVCEQCGGNCDNGELTGGVCPECLDAERRRKKEVSAILRLINSQPYQMEFRMEETRDGK